MQKWNLRKLFFFNYAFIERKCFSLVMVKLEIQYISL